MDLHRVKANYDNLVKKGQEKGQNVKDKHKNIFEYIKDKIEKEIAKSDARI
jgi:hypothetical protein